ncbi:hypothetical protein ACFWY9_04120 [Amycolatopsis sp. NPDC059027]|uniref:hypothetical protein n=1 Tax=unclassified Amycolatopsis TaxID=2618356 RepID=UPI00366CC237
MSGNDFDALYAQITSAAPGELMAAAAAWRGFAVACHAQAAKAGHTASEIGRTPTAPYQAAVDRLTPIGRRVDALAARAQSVSSQLAAAGEVGAQALMEAQVQKAKVDAARTAQANASREAGGGDTGVHPNGAAGLGTNAPLRAQAMAEQEGAAALQIQVDRVAKAYNAFQPATTPAPDTGGGGDAGGATDGGGAGGGSSRTSTSTSASAPPPASPPAHGSPPGDFDGWVRDPRTGYLIDPVSGQEYSPQDARYVDPVTGKPFGDVDRYASRLEGLSGGAPLTGGVPLAGGASRAPLFGGGVPPSLDPANPAAAQLQQAAAQAMAAKAAAARGFAAAMGGQQQHPPFVPHGGGAARGARRAPRSGTPAKEPRSVWGGHPVANRRADKEKRGDPDDERHRAGADDDVWADNTRLPTGLLDNER